MIVFNTQKRFRYLIGTSFANFSKKALYIRMFCSIMILYATGTDGVLGRFMGEILKKVGILT